MSDTVTIQKHFVEELVEKIARMEQQLEKMNQLERYVKQITTDYLKYKQDDRIVLTGDQIREFIGKSKQWWKRAANKDKLKIDGRDILFKEAHDQRSYRAYKSDLEEWLKLQQK